MSEATRRLIERMRTYDGDLDATEDIPMAWDSYAGEENEGDTLPHLCQVAAEHCHDWKELMSARAFIRDYINTVWACSMIEGNNPAYRSVGDEAPNLL